MFFSGLQKSDLVNYPSLIACTLWLKGCNLACPYCHNPQLVGRKPVAAGASDVSEDDFFSFVEKRSAFLEGVVISGGEATLYEELPAFLNRVRENTVLKIKLDTNLTNPSMLFELASRKLVDCIAGDIKAPLDDYGAFALVGSDPKGLSDRIRESLGVLNSFQVDFELRTTCVRNILGSDSFVRMKEDVVSCLPDRKIVWYLQQFRGDVTLSPDYAFAEGYGMAELERLSVLLTDNRVCVRPR